MHRRRSIRRSAGRHCPRSRWNSPSSFYRRGLRVSPSTRSTSVVDSRISSSIAPSCRRTRFLVTSAVWRRYRTAAGPRHRYWCAPSRWESESALRMPTLRYARMRRRFGRPIGAAGARPRPARPSATRSSSPSGTCSPQASSTASSATTGSKSATAPSAGPAVT